MSQEENNKQNENGNGNESSTQGFEGQGKDTEINGAQDAAPQEEAVEETQADPLEELNRKYLLLFAEFENYRKRTAREKADLIKGGGSDVIKSILPVIDDLDRAIKANEQAHDIELVKEGFKLIHNKFMNIMQAKGVKMMELNGKEFNADVSEAIANIPAPSEELKGKVVDVVENGYTMNDQVIRFAKVVVGQ
jgi:molecular chaperone GrpE